MRDAFALQLGCLARSWIFRVKLSCKLQDYIGARLITSRGDIKFRPRINVYSVFAKHVNKAKSTRPSLPRTLMWDHTRAQIVRRLKRLAVETRTEAPGEIGQFWPISHLSGELIDDDTMQMEEMTKGESEREGPSLLKT